MRETPIHFIKEFEKKLKNFFHDFSDNSHLIQSAKYICLSGKSKRVRPYLVSIFANHFKVSKEFALDIAFVSELVHTASLLHDDILDEAEKRRGNPTVHSIYSIPTAVLTGDWLYSKSLGIVRDYGKEIYKNIVEVSAEMSFSVAMEYQLRNNANWKFDQWLEIAKGKTANLFSWSGESIFKLKYPKSESKNFFYACLLCGIVFQILDDVKDFVAINDTKNIYKDIMNGNINFLLVQALEEHSTFYLELEKFFSLSPNDKKNSLDSILEFTFSDSVINSVISVIQQALNLSYHLFQNYSCLEIYFSLEKWLLLYCSAIQWNPAINKSSINKIFTSLKIKEAAVNPDNIFFIESK